MTSSLDKVSDLSHLISPQYINEIKLDVSDDLDLFGASLGILLSIISTSLLFIFGFFPDFGAFFMTTILLSFGLAVFGSEVKKTLSNGTDKLIKPLAYLETKITEKGVLLKIVDRHQKIVRQKIFNSEQEIEMLETIVLWENEISSLHTTLTDNILEKDETYTSNKELLFIANNAVEDANRNIYLTNNKN